MLFAKCPPFCWPFWYWNQNILRFTRLGHFQWLGPNVGRQISQIWIEYKAHRTNVWWKFVVYSTLLNIEHVTIPFRHFPTFECHWEAAVLEAKNLSLHLITTQAHSFQNPTLQQLLKLSLNINPFFVCLSPSALKISKFPAHPSDPTQTPMLRSIYMKGQISCFNSYWCKWTH